MPRRWGRGGLSGGWVSPGRAGHGGVRFDNLDVVREMGFGGALILGDAWRIGV